MTNVVPLRPVERVCQDAEPIAAVCRSVSPAKAELIVTRALGDLALTMAGLQRQVRAHDLGDVTTRLRRVQRTADHLGMVTLAAVAGDVGDCIEAGDITAFAAVFARLCRVAETALSPDFRLMGSTV